MTTRTVAAPPRRAASSGTAERFAARVRSRRRRRWASVAAAVVLLGALVGLAFSPWLAVRSVQVSGTDRVPVAAVEQALVGELGRPMVLVDTAAAAQRVAGVPLVRSARVTRVWPGTVAVTVVERQPVAAVPAGGTAVRLVDADGVEVERAARRPAALPYLDVDVGKPGALTSALDVLSSLPVGLRAVVGTVGATSRDGVWLRLVNGAQVTWGGQESGAEKARVLLALLRTAPDAATYDVSAPSAPAVSGRRLARPVSVP